MKFTEENIQNLFGNEAAEDEVYEKLQSYYIKSDTHEKIAANLPLRILVGHKGIGKSAIIKILLAENKDESNLAILIKPDDISSLGKSSNDFLETIREWKIGLLEIIASKAISSVGLTAKTETESKLYNIAGQITTFLAETFSKKIEENINLDPAKKLIIESFLRNKKIVVFIDDLDRGWQSRKEDIHRISALLNAVRDLANENPGIQFKISLRTDVYFLVRTSDESTDKIEGSVIWHSWNNHEILLLLIKRIKSFFNEPFDVERMANLEQKNLAYYLDDIFEKKFQDYGKWSDAPMYRVLMSLIRKRPRDLVKLCTLAARSANQKGHDKILTSDLKEIFQEYSQGRIQDTVNEYKTELPDIERLLLGMKPNQKQIKENRGFVYSTNELKTKINSIIERGKFVYTSGKIATPTDLAQLLYKINFITGRKVLSDGLIDRKYFEENRYLSSNLVDFGYEWEIHPAFRWVLQVDRIDDIFNSLSLSSDIK